MGIFALLFVFLVPLSAGAAAINACGDLNRIELILEPVHKNLRSLPAGDRNTFIRIAQIDTNGEPACCSRHLILLVPSADETGTLSCFVLSQEKANDGETGYVGFRSIDFDRLTTSFDPAKGLLLNVPYKIYIDENKFQNGLAKVRADAKNGTVTLE